MGSRTIRKPNVTDGRTHGRTDAHTHGQRENSIPATKFAEGIISTKYHVLAQMELVKIN